jgi:hypothetical protein
MSEPREKVLAEFMNVMSRHGFSYQYAVMREAERLFHMARSSFRPEVAEFPVELKGARTKIDFVLLDSPPSHTALVSECKRANPAISNWCFARAPFIRRDRTTERIYLDRLTRSGAGNWEVRFGYSRVLDRAYHVAFEVKTQSKGDPSGSRADIEDAASQVCRATNGLLDFCTRRGGFFTPITDIEFLPVIFTTARLWVSETALNTADLHTGVINTTPDLTQVDWLIYQYHVSTGVKMDSERASNSEDLADLLETEFIRSIAIVSSSGIETFLHWASELSAESRAAKLQHLTESI